MEWNRRLGDLAAEQELLVILRPGPYTHICAERNNAIDLKQMVEIVIWIHTKNVCREDFPIDC